MIGRTSCRERQQISEDTETNLTMTFDKANNNLNKNEKLFETIATDNTGANDLDSIITPKPLDRILNFLKRNIVTFHKTMSLIINIKKSPDLRVSVQCQQT